MAIAESDDGEQDGERKSNISLRILAYNIHHGRGTDDQIDLDRIANVILQADPDIVALQEVDQRTRRSNQVDQTAALGKLTGMHYQFLKQIDFEGGEYGQAILSKFPIDELQIHWLPGEPDRERRIVGMVQVQHPVGRFLFGSTHLHHANESFRNRQASRLTEVAQSSQLPFVVAGDFNATPDSKCIQSLAVDWAVSTPTEIGAITESSSSFATFPAIAADRQIDYIMAFPKQNWEAGESVVYDESLASDHRPLLSVMNFSYAGTHGRENE